MDDIKWPSLSKYSCFDFLISLTTLFQAILYIPQKLSSFALSEEAFAFSNRAFGVPCNPWKIIESDRLGYNLFWDGFLSSREDGICNVFDILVFIVIRLYYVSKMASDNNLQYLL